MQAGRQAGLDECLLVFAEQAASLTNLLQQYGIPLDDGAAGIGVVTNVIGAGAEAAESITATVTAKAAKLQEKILKDLVLKKINDFNAKFRPPSMSVEDKWRFVFIGVFFGITILLAAVLAIAIWRMRFPKATSFIVVLLWLDVAVLMLLGAGTGPKSVISTNRPWGCGRV